MKGMLEIYDLNSDFSTVTSPIEEEQPIHPLASWSERVTPQLTVPSEFFSSTSISTSFRRSASVDMELRVHYPFARLSHHKILLIVKHLGSVLGPENCGLEFGYDILPDAVNLENINDVHIFTGGSHFTFISPLGKRQMLWIEYNSSQIEREAVKQALERTAKLIAIVPV